MAELKVNVNESLIINGKQVGGNTTKSITGINNFFKTSMLIPNSETEIYTTDASVIKGAQFDRDLVKYVRISNLDTTYAIDLIIQNSADDEVGYNLKAGQSLLLWDHGSTVLEANGAAVTVAAGAVGACGGGQTVTDGDAAHGMTNGQYLKLISTDGTSKNYVLCDTNAGGPATGTVLAGTTDIGSGTLDGVTGATTEPLVGVAVSGNLSSLTQNGFLVQLKAAIEHANGHNGKITVSAVPGEANGNQSITITQLVPGAAGNTVTTENLANFTSADFASGADGVVTGKVFIKSIAAIANMQSVRVEILVASV